MGIAGRQHVRSNFDWPVVVRQIQDLLNELAHIRQSTTRFDSTPFRSNPVKGDPFTDFASFASKTLTSDLVLRLGRGTMPDTIRQSEEVELDQFSSEWRATSVECITILDDLHKCGSLSVAAILSRFPAHRRRPIKLGLMWMCKMGFLEWLASK
jgi:D-inositol-3-phosphate glycosyltransferase